MGRKKLPGGEGRGKFELNVRLTPRLYRRLEQARAQREVDLGRFVRELLDWALELEQRDPEGETRRGLYSLTITLRPELYRYLRLAALYHGISLDAMIHRMLDEHVEQYITQGEQWVREIRRLREERGDRRTSERLRADRLGRRPLWPRAKSWARRSGAGKAVALGGDASRAGM
jgi:predicted HicB family RNase H-like nuclease